MAIGWRAGQPRAIDRIRRDQLSERKPLEWSRRLEEVGKTDAPDFEQIVNDDIDDDLLRLIFIACHPVLSIEARVALSFQLLGGLATSEIARTFLTPTPTIAQRIARAKRTLSATQIPFIIPEGSQRMARPASVLEVIYLIFNEGYSATATVWWR